MASPTPQEAADLALSLGLDFDGDTYDHDRDHDRLAVQLGRVRRFMSDGKPHLLRDIARGTGDPEASVSARLRDLRKPKHGGYTIEREYVDRGLWSYRMVKG